MDVSYIEWSLDPVPPSLDRSYEWFKHQPRRHMSKENPENAQEGVEVPPSPDAEDMKSLSDAQQRAAMIEDAAALGIRIPQNSVSIEAESKIDDSTTLDRMHKVLLGLGHTVEQAEDIIREFLNAGIHFHRH
jgi:hypothetical protein